MNKRMRRTVTDLGIITVETVGYRDTVRLAHNGLLVFALTCKAGKASKLRINPKFYEYDMVQWRAVYAAYLAHKRRTLPSFKLPSFSGRRADGQPHPWRRVPAHVKTMIQETQKREHKNKKENQ